MFLTFSCSYIDFLQCVRSLMLKSHIKLIWDTFISLTNDKTTKFIHDVLRFHDSQWFVKHDVQFRYYNQWTWNHEKWGKYSFKALSFPNKVCSRTRSVCTIKAIVIISNSSMHENIHNWFCNLISTTCHYFTHKRSWTWIKLIYFIWFISITWHRLPTNVIKCISVMNYRNIMRLSRVNTLRLLRCKFIHSISNLIWYCWCL